MSPIRLMVNSSRTGLTSFQFQHLLQLILNEEQSRHHVENEVISIEQRVAEIEHNYKTKEPRYEKIGFLNMRKQRRRSAA